MELPNYFLADLADRSTLTPQLITDACHTLKQNRLKFLATLSTENIITILAKLGREWLDPDFFFRKMALELGPSQTGFGTKTLADGLDRYFKQLTNESLESLVIQDLGSLTRLDEFTADNIESRQDRSSIARGPDLLVQITGGCPTLPSPASSSGSSRVPHNSSNAPLAHLSCPECLPTAYTPPNPSSAPASNWQNGKAEPKTLRTHCLPKQAV